MLAQYAAEFIVLGLFVLSGIMVLAEILIRDPATLRDLITDSADMARPPVAAPAQSAEIHHFPARRANFDAGLRKAA